MRVTSVMSWAIALALMAMAVPAVAQMTGASPTPGVVVTGGDNATVNLAANAQAVVDWSAFNLKKGNFLEYQALLPGGSEVLNKVDAGVLAKIYGEVRTDGSGPASLYFFAPGGILFGEGAKIDTNGGSFFAAAAARPGANDAAFWGMVPADRMNVAPSLYAQDAVLEITKSVHNGPKSNLWLIGTEYDEDWTYAKSTFDGLTKDGYTVGATWFDMVNPLDAYKNVATLDVKAGGAAPFLAVNSGETGKMWLGRIEDNTPGGSAVNAQVEGLQIWMPSVKAASFAALGGTDAGKLWNAGVWVYGPYTDPINFTFDLSKYGDPVIDTTNPAGPAWAGNVHLDGVFVWVSGPIHAKRDVFIGRPDMGDPTKTGKALSVWLTDVVSEGGDVSLYADETSGTFEGIGDDLEGTIWVNSIEAKYDAVNVHGGKVTVRAENEFVVWLDGALDTNLTNDKGITSDQDQDGTAEDVSDGNIDDLVDGTPSVVKVDPAITANGGVERASYWY